MASHLPPDVSRGPQMLAAIWTLDAVATIIVGLRCIASFRINRKLTLADYIMLGALAFGLSNTICITVAEHYGLGRHIYYLQPQQIVKALKYQTIAEPLGIMCPGLGRISFAVYLLKLIGTSKPKWWILQLCIWVGLFINLLTVVLILAQCQHVQSIYDSHYPGWCWSKNVQTYVSYVQGVFLTLIDFTLTILPAWIVWHLQMPRNIKLGLSVLLGLSLFAGIAGIARTVEVKHLADHGDITYNLESFIIWFTIENFTVMTAASIPYLKIFFNKNRNNSGYDKYHFSSNNNSNSASKSRMRPVFKSRESGITKETTITQVVMDREDDRSESELELRQYGV